MKFSLKEHAPQSADNTFPIRQVHSVYYCTKSLSLLGQNICDFVSFDIKLAKVLKSLN